MDIAVIFGHLIEDKTLVSLHLDEKNYESLTMLTDTRENKKKFSFSIDAPPGFADAVRGIGEWLLTFEFTGRDKVKYSFVAKGGEIADNEIWIPFPDKIDRFQRRDDFRVFPIEKVLLKSRARGSKLTMEIINLSMGGALVRRQKIIESAPSLELNRKFIDLEIKIPGEKDNARVRIKRAMVVRIDDSPRKNRFHYALKFLKVDKKEQNALRKSIYAIQRNEIQRMKAIQ